MARSSPKRRSGRSRKGWFPWKSAGCLLLLAAAGVWFRLRPGLPPSPAVPARETGSGRVPAPVAPAPPPAAPRLADPAVTTVSSNRFRHLPDPAADAAAFVPRGVTNLLEAQIALSAHGISAGSIDGNGGAQTAAALRAFQMQAGLEQTGWLDRPTRERLLLTAPPVSRLDVTAADLSRLAPIPGTWLGKSQLAALDHETLVELVAESSQSHPALIRRLNPSVDWEHPAAGMRLAVPSPVPAVARRPALVRISLAGRYLRAFDGDGDLLVHFPCSIASRVEKRPVGDLHVLVAVANPDYTFDPEVFPESAEAKALDRRLRLPPGPNNPVGVAWIGLDRPGYGIHGTPRPEEVGRTESHGCFRLANWNADLLRRMAWVGLPVRVEP